MPLIPRNIQPNIQPWMAASVKGQDPNVHEKVLRVHDQNSISQNSPGEPCLFYLDLRKLENCALEAALALVELRAGAATVGEPPGIHDDPSDGGALDWWAKPSRR